MIMINDNDMIMININDDNNGIFTKEIKNK